MIYFPALTIRHLTVASGMCRDTFAFSLTCDVAICIPDPFGLGFLITAKGRHFKQLYAFNIVTTMEVMDRRSYTLAHVVHLYWMNYVYLENGAAELQNNINLLCLFFSLHCNWHSKEKTDSDSTFMPLTLHIHSYS